MGNCCCCKNKNKEIKCDGYKIGIIKDDYNIKIENNNKDKKKDSINDKKMNLRMQIIKYKITILKKEKKKIVLIMEII